jgi:hypothetical protein
MYVYRQYEVMRKRRIDKYKVLQMMECQSERLEDAGQPFEAHPGLQCFSRQITGRERELWGTK